MKYALLFFTALSVCAQQPKLVTRQATIDLYPLTNYPGGSNAIITLYKSTSLGTVWTPFKPTAVFPATRPSTYFQVVAPNTFQFYATATVQPWGESGPTSPPVTNTVSSAALTTRLTLSRQMNAKLKTKNKAIKANEKVKLTGPRRDSIGVHRSPN